MVSRGRAIFWGALAVVLTAIVTWGLATGAYGAEPGARGVVRRLFNAPGLSDLAKGLALIQTQYFGTTDANTLAQAALQSAVGALGDPYSAYLSPAAYRALQSNASGRYTGIGIEVQSGADGVPVVVRVFADSPAAHTPHVGQSGGTPGLRAGDRLVSVDGKSVRGVPEEVVRTLIVGAQGSQVALEVMRNTASGDTALTFRMTRAPIQIQTATGSMLPGQVGYLDIQLFNQTTPAQVQTVLARLQAEGMRALVVDLRDNPGGLLDAALGVSRFLLPGGVVAYLQPKTGARQPLVVPSPHPVGVPYAVLVDGYTASAAELLAGAVQDDRAGILLGERTFGKGSVQKVFPLGGGGALKLTVAHYLTPAGRDIHGQGITPDVTVAWPNHAAGDMGDPGTDPQLAAAMAALRTKAAA